MNVLLLHLPLARRSFLSRFAVPEPLAQLYLAPALRERHELRLVDLRVTPDLRRELGRFRPDAVVVGTNPLTFATAERVLPALRGLFPGVRILLVADAEYGNTHVSERPLDFAHAHADALVEPYFLAPQARVTAQALAAWEDGLDLAAVPGLLYRDGSGGWRRSAAVPNVAGDVGVPDRTLLGRARGRYRFGGIGRMAHLFYTYGCTYKCRFCPMSKHDGSLSARPIGDVVRELRELSEPHVYLQDFEPFLVPGAMEELADAVERAGIRKRYYMLTRSDTALEQERLIARWRRLGLRWLYLGLDGQSDARLREERKGNTVENNERALRRMRALGLCVSVGFVVRSDFTRDDFAELREYVLRLRPSLVAFTVETPLVGTTLFDETADRLTTRDWTLFDLEHAVLPTTLPLDEFYRELAKLQWLGGRRSIPALLRHFPLRDVARNWAAGLPALNALRRSARDHRGVTPRADEPPGMARASA